MRRLVLVGRGLAGLTINHADRRQPGRARFETEVPRRSSALGSAPGRRGECTGCRQEARVQA